MVDIQPYLQRILERVNRPDVQASLKGFNRTLLFKFTDTNEDWVIKTVDGKEVTLVKESSANPDVTIITTTVVLSGVMDHKINPLGAYMQRKIQTIGSMDDLVRMQKLIL